MQETRSTLGLGRGEHANKGTEAKATKRGCASRNTTWAGTCHENYTSHTMDQVEDSEEVYIRIIVT